MINTFPEEILNFSNSTTKPIEDILIEHLNYQKTDCVKTVREISKNILFNKLMPYYNKRDIDPNLYTFNFMVEPLKNSFFHSEGNSDINVDLLLSPSAFVFGINDGGNYFKRLEIKQYWEARKIHPEKHKAPQKEIGFGIGTGLVYRIADLIYVENSSGTLYVGSKIPGKLFSARN